jgi:PAS domain S-box-containing protein
MFFLGKKLRGFFIPKKDPFENAPELDILVQKGNTLHVLLLVLLFVYSSAYTIINYYQGAYTEMYLTMIPIVFVAVEHVLYLRGYIVVSKVMNLFQITTVVGLLSMVHSPENGVLAFYIPILVGTQLTFFGRERIYAHILTVYLFVALVFFLTTDIRFEEKLTGKALETDMFVNFVGASLATVFEILFILSVSNKIQQNLFEKSHQLNKQNEELLKLSLIATKTKSGVIITDNKGAIEWINEAFTNISGYELHEIINKKPKDFLQPEGYSHPGFDLLRENLWNKKYVETIVPNRKKDGTIYMNQLEINPIFNEQNELINFISIQRDITQDINQKEEIIRINNRFNLISQQADIGIWVWDVAKNQTIWNDIMITQYGSKRAEIEHDFFGFWQDSIYWEDKERTMLSIDRLMKGEGSIIENDLRIIRKDSGEMRYLKTVTISERDSGGNLLQLLGTSIDVTREKEMQLSIQNKNTELERTNAELDRFVYSVSHDLRSPLLSIKGLLALVFDLEKLDPQVDNYLRMAEKSIHRLDDIIKEILEYSRNARMEVQHEPVDISLVVEEIYEDLKFSVEESFDFRMKLNDLKIIYSDRARIHTLLRNLIGNAVKYRKKREDVNSFVEFRAYKKNHELILEVEDNGEGIEEKNREKIFDMFFRASKSSAGTGLGLYIGKQISDKLQGKFELVSSKETGSIFRITLPEKQQTI